MLDCNANYVRLNNGNIDNNLSKKSTFMLLDTNGTSIKRNEPWDVLIDLSLEQKGCFKETYYIYRGDIFNSINTWKSIWSFNLYIRSNIYNELELMKFRTKVGNI